MEKVNESFTYGVILDSFILAYVKYETKLIEKQEVLSQYVEFCEVNNHSSIEMSLTQKIWKRVSYIFIVLGINKYIVYMYVLYIQYIYTLRVLCPLVLQSYTIYVAVNTPTLRKDPILTL